MTIRTGGPTACAAQWRGVPPPCRHRRRALQHRRVPPAPTRPGGHTPPEVWSPVHRRSAAGMRGLRHPRSGGRDAPTLAPPARPPWVRFAPYERYLEVGEEAVAVQQMVALERAGQYAEVVRLCEQHVKARPDCLTSYLLLGFAYGKLGDREKAVANLQHVVANAGDDPEYAQATSS